MKSSRIYFWVTVGLAAMLTVAAVTFTFMADQVIIDRRLANLHLAIGLLLSSGTGLFLLVLWRYDAAWRQAERLERERRELENRDRHLGAILRNVVDPVLLIGPDLRVRDVSTGFARVFGYTLEEMRAGRPESLVYPEDLPAYRTFVQNLLATSDQEFRLSMRVRCADGALRQAEVVARNLLADQDIRAILAQVRDLTPAYEAQAALLEQQRLNRLVTEHSIEILALYSPSGETTYVSPAAKVILGYTPQEYMAASVAEVVHPDDLEGVLDARRRSLAGEPVRVEYRIRRKGGSYVWFETLTRPIWEDPGELVAVVASSRDITERKQYEEQLTRLAYQDHLTGLPNRVAFLESLTERLATGAAERYGVLHLDLDNFKVVNDSLGHEAGDALLIEFAARLRSLLPPPHMVARMTGDEFAVLLDREALPEEPAGFCARLAGALDQPVRAGVRDVQISLSMGLALQGKGSTAATDLLRQATVAVHHAKQQGKGRCLLYHPSMSDGAMERLELEVDLRRALRQGQLTLQYQPVVDLETGQIISAEALLRWHHPEKGWVSPALFIPLAEQAGYIDQIGRFVLAQAARDAGTWPGAGRLGVSVNLSALQLQRPQIVEEVLSVLATTGLRPDQLTLEITETALMQDPTNTREILQRLRSHGIRIAIDDFGTGHSSLSYLKEFPVDILKIDRAFVSGLGRNLVDRALARTVVHLARALGLRVVAEGVESAEQLAELRELECDGAQGYYFARPMPVDGLVDLWLKSQAAD